VNLDYPEIDPEFPLYHGTSLDAWRSIREQGLRPMSRQYVHLSRTRTEARRVGQRHAESPVLLTVKPEGSHHRKFFRAGPVVLTNRVPPQWLTPIEGMHAPTD
jgi:putative RNA 2'-phosphotransferase